MSNDSQAFERALTSKDIAAMIGIAESTVRKYAAALEEAGYPFSKDGEGEKAARIFTDSDAMVMRHLKELREKTQIPVDQAAQLIAAKHPKHGGTLQVAAFDATVPKVDVEAMVNDINERYDKRYIALEAKIDSLMSLINTMGEKLDERDAVIRELAEAFQAQKAIAAASEENADKRIQQAIDDALDRHSERMKDEVERRDGQITTFMREQLAMRQEIAAAREAIEKDQGRSLWSRLFGK